jgi:hypothetical protein
VDERTSLPANAQVKPVTHQDSPDMNTDISWFSRKASDGGGGFAVQA